MPKIAIDATPLLPRPSGIGMYVTHLIEALEALSAQGDFDLEIVYQPGLKNWLRGNLYFPDYLHSRSPKRIIPLPVRLSNLFLRVPELFLPIVERQFAAPDIFHGTNHTVFPFKQSLRALTIHDLTFVKYPQYTNTTVKAYAEQVRQCLKWTNLVLTVSHSSKRDIVRYFGFNPDHIHVTPLASRYEAKYLANHFIADQKSQLEQASGYDFTRPYILFVSTIEPRKNITGLIAAFDYLKQKHRLDHQLVLIGQKGWHYEPIFERIARSPYRAQIHHLSYLSDELVALFYAQAAVFVYPSHYEGFGLPVLEAMTLGAPVVTTNIASLPEVAGDAALLVPPQDDMALAEGIWAVLSNGAWRDRLIQTGYQQAQSFSWQRTAQLTVNAYQSLLP
jgi:glycosyltransferase involved in cell wall biosynthesis